MLVLVIFLGLLVGRRMGEESHPPGREDTTRFGKEEEDAK